MVLGNQFPLSKELVMRPNRLRELLRAGKPSLGTRILSSWPTTVELIGQSGMFDYVEFLGEYSPYDLYSLENLGRAADLFEHMSAMMKIEQEPRTYLAVRAIGSGIQNLLFADIRSVEDAQECVQAVRAESPQTGGRHGVGMRRDVGVVLEGATQQFVDALEEAVVAIMIEKEPAVESLESILSVTGVDMIQFGPADYSMSVGLAGQLQHPRVKEAERHVIETALKMGVTPRVELFGFEGMEPYLEMGVQHFNVGVDMQTLFQWYCDTGKKVRDELNIDPLIAADARQKTSYGR